MITHAEAGASLSCARALTAIDLVASQDRHEAVRATGGGVRRVVSCFAQRAGQLFSTLVRVNAPMLHEFITTHRAEIIGRCRAKVASRQMSRPKAADAEHGVPVFLDQLVTVMRLGLEASPLVTRTALLHGQELHLQGLSAADVVHDYGDVCQSVTELAIERDARIIPEDFRVLNRCLDDAIAGAVTAYGHAESVQAREVITVIGTDTERLALLMDDLRKESHTATLAFEAIKSGRVGVTGSTGAVVDVSLRRIATLLDGSRSGVQSQA